MKQRLTIEVKSANLGYSPRGGWYWRIKASNGEIIGHSEVFKRKADCLTSALRITYCKEWKMKLLKRGE